jgi:ATP-dependent DNA ligase
MRGASFPLFVSICVRKEDRMKKLHQLIQECQDKGIPVPEGKGLSKEYLIQRLAGHHLQDNTDGIPPLEQIAPQLAKDIRDIPEAERVEVLKSDRFACGEKINGVRGILHIRPEGIRITSRNRCENTHLMNELTGNLPHLCAMDLGSWEGSILDGELYLKKDFVSLNAKATALEATSALLHCSPDKAKEFQHKNGLIRYHIFDAIRVKGNDLAPLPLRERLKYLDEFRRVVQPMGYEGIIDFETLVLSDKEEYIREVLESGGEGVVFKDLDAPYSLGSRPRSWLKLKRKDTVDAIIIGYERGKEWDRKGLVGSVELGIFDEGGDLRSIGRVSSLPLKNRLEMTELAEGIPTLKKAFLGTVVECCFQDLNKKLRGRHLQILAFRNGSNSKSIGDCFLNLSNEKQNLRRAGIPIPAPIAPPDFLTAYLQNS